MTQSWLGCQRWPPSTVFTRFRVSPPTYCTCIYFSNKYDARMNPNKIVLTNHIIKHVVRYALQLCLNLNHAVNDVSPPMHSSRRNNPSGSSHLTSNQNASPLLQWHKARKDMTKLLPSVLAFKRFNNESPWQHHTFNTEWEIGTTIPP